MSGSLCPEHLYKDELVFEVRARGAEPASDVASLRTQLRGLLASKFVSAWPSSLVAEDELEACKLKLEEWEGRYEELRDEPPTSRARLRFVSRLLHLQGRVVLLATAGSFRSEELGWLRQAAANIEQLLTAVVAKTPGPVASGPDSKAMPDQVLTVPENVPEPTLSQLESVAPATASVPVRIASSNLASASYHKLPNPLTPLLQALPCVDGLEVHKLLKFLGDLFRIREIPGVDDSLLLSLLIPYCRPPLSNLLNSVLGKNGRFEDFHRETLDTFVPGRMREDLKMRMFYRSQGLREGLAAYVTDVCLAGRILQVSLSEAEVVQVILDGITPEERSRLVFSSKPVTFSGLERLVVTARNIQLIDQRREEESRSLDNRPPRPMVRQVATAPEPVMHRPVPVCYGCGRPGHIRRFCRQRPEPKNGQGGGLPR